MKRTWTLLAILVLFTGAVHGAVIAERAAVSSPERLTTAAGLNVLRSGGSAADAAVAMAFTLAVLRPDAAGPGGGGTAIYFDASTGEVWVLDFRAVPANPSYLEGVSPESIAPLGVPGFVAGLGELHRKFGARKWSDLIAPATALAGEPGERAEIVARIDQELLVRPIDALDSGEAVAGDSLATVLQRIARRGAVEFYSGDPSRRIVERSKAAGGAISLRALAEYEPRWRSPLRIEFRGDEIHTIPSPSGGGNALAELIAILSGFNWEGIDPAGPRAAHLFIEAERHAWTASRRLSSERGTVARPATSDPKRLSEIRAAIEAGPTDQDVPQMSSNSRTVGLTVRDEGGNVAVLALTLGPPFGTGHLVDDAYYIGEVRDDNLSSLNLPMIVVRDGAVKIATVASGRETDALVPAKIYLFGRLLGFEPEKAISLPRFVPDENPRTVICERGTDFSEIEGLNLIGHGVTWRDSIGIVQWIEVGDEVVTVSDPRGGTAGGY